MKAWLGQSIARKLLASFVGIFSITYLLTAIFVFTSVRNSSTCAGVRLRFITLRAQPPRRMR